MRNYNVLKPFKFDGRQYYEGDKIELDDTYETRGMLLIKRIELDLVERNKDFVELLRTGDLTAPVTVELPPPPPVPEKRKRGRPRKVH